MSIETLRETADFKLIRDTLQGVTRFIRKNDGAVTFWNTGYAAQVEIQSVYMMRDSVFDEYAADNEYHD